MRFQDKVIIVTGSTTGIGEAIARQCVAEGGRVLVHGLEEHLGRRVVESLGDRAALHLDDLADPEAPERITRAAMNAFGRIDAICNNAAITRRSTIHTTDLALFERIMAINVRAPLFIIKAALDQLERNGGCVLNMGSSNALGGEHVLLPYAISKAGLMAMSRNLATGLKKPFVRVNYFLLGWVLSENERKLKISEGKPEDWPERVDPRTVPSGRMTRPEDIARAAAYWLSDDSRPFSGSVIELSQFSLIGHH